MGIATKERKRRTVLARLETIISLLAEAESVAQATRYKDTVTARGLPASILKALAREIQHITTLQAKVVALPHDDGAETAYKKISETSKLHRGRRISL